LTFSRRTIPALTAMFAASFALTGVAAADPSNLTLHTAADSDQTNDRTPDLTFDGANAAEVVTLRVARSSHSDDGWTTTDSTTAGNDGTGELTDNLAITDPNDIVTLAADGDSGAMSQVQTMVNVVPVLSGASFSDGATVPAGRVAFSFSHAIRSQKVILFVDGHPDSGDGVYADSDGNSPSNSTSEDITGMLAPSVALSPGPHTAYARTVDAATNESSDSALVSFNVSPPAPAFDALVDGDQLNQNGPALVIGGVDPAATDVSVLEYDPNNDPENDNDDYLTLGHSSVVTNAKATVTTNLVDGSHQLELTQTVEGVTSVLSDPTSVTVKTSAPVLDAIDALSNDASPWFSASNLLELNDEHATAIKLYVDGHLAATDSNFGIDGDSLHPDVPIADGSHSAYVTTVDDLGHESVTPSNTIAFAIDTNAPALPFAVSPANATTVTTSSPTVTLHTEPGATVHLVVDDTQDEGNRTADAEGNVTFTLSAKLADGTHTLYYWARDAALNDTEVNSSTFVVKTATTTAPATTPDPAPAVTTPVVTTPVTPVTPTVPTIVVLAPSKVSLSSHTLTADKPVKVGFTLKKAGTIKVTITKVVGGKTIVVATVSVKAKAGSGSYTLKTKFGGKKLAKGNYKVTLATVSGKKTSKPTAAQKIKVG
jgi:hypothetical protein